MEWLQIGMARVVNKLNLSASELNMTWKYELNKFKSRIENWSD